MGRREVKRETWRARGRVPYRCGRAFYYRMHLNTKRPGSSTTRTLLLWNLSDIPEGSCVTRDHPLLYGRVHFVHTVLFILFLYFFRQRHFSLFISFFFCVIFLQVSITDEIQPAEKRLFRYSRAQIQRDQTPAWVAPSTKESLAETIYTGERNSESRFTILKKKKVWKIE